jgi:hypothetical protein
MQLYRRWLAIYNAFEYKGMLRTLRKRFDGLLIEASWKTIWKLTESFTVLPAFTGSISS